MLLLDLGRRFRAYLNLMLVVVVVVAAGAVVGGVLITRACSRASHQAPAHR
jgi:hypothetical protein